MSNQEDIVIKVEGVYKDFDLPHEAQNSLKTRILHPMSKGKNIEKQHALKDISFEIKKGEFFGIVGRNGSGKSTLLKILAEIYTPTKGKVTVNGSLTPFIELGVGFNPELTGRENVYLNGAMLGFNKKEIEAMYTDIVEFAELEKFMDQKLKNYSSGMQVRLAFSVAIQAKSDVLLLDEVLAVGDADFQRKCFDYFRSLKKNDTTVVFISHDMDAIRAFCDRAILIDDSSITVSGDVNTVADRYSELFMDKLQKRTSSSELGGKRRRGKGWATIQGAKLKSEMLTDKDEELTFEITIRIEHEHTNLMTGFAVKDPEGHLINGTNTWETGEDLPSLAPGDICKVKWSNPNIYVDGFYTITTYVYGEGNEMYDEIEDILTFQVKRTRRSGFLVTPKHSMKVETLKRKKK